MDGIIKLIGVWDDSRTGEFATGLRKTFPTIFENPRENDMIQGESQSWFGIVGITGDMLPFVGKPNVSLTDRTSTPLSEMVRTSGEFIEAGFNGGGSTS
ncbi:hypothetical protein F4818DRAFT_435956 [Hypoxylon cercidicola]|nr:hypothetical protein F4818DRAFT_435956 [Hypoxylon cercidicola]